MRRFVLIGLLAAALTGLAAGCVRTVHAPQPPPAPKLEEPPPAPSEGDLWLLGHWTWNGRRYAWVEGRWIPPRDGSWESGRWERRAWGYLWLPGHWRD